MRRTAAALVAALTVTAAVAGPATAAAAQDPIDQIEEVTCGTVGPPACDLINQLEALLAPLRPVLDLAGPLLGQLGSAVNDLGAIGALASSGSGAPAGELAGAAQGVLDQLGALTDPLLGLLGGSGQLDSLTTTLEDLGASLETLPVGGALAPITEPAAAPKAASGEGPTPARSASAAPAAGFGAPVSTGAAAPSASPSGGSALPAIPAGSALSLSPLALPDLGFASEGIATADEAAAEAVVEDVILPAVGASSGAGEPESSAAMAVVAVLSALLLASGVALDQLRKARHVIAD